MAKLSTNQIREKARQIVANNKGGIKYGDIVDQVLVLSPETPKNTINGSVWDLHIRYPQEISKPSRGLFVPITGIPASTETPVEHAPDCLPPVFHQNLHRMPTSMTLEDQSRLEALCMLFGVGFVLFETIPDKPRFQIRVRAQKFTPDMFYVNEFAERLKEFDPDKFEQLFR